MKQSLLNLCRWFVFILAVLLMNAPIIATFITSLKNPAEITRNAGLIVQQPTLDNYVQIFGISERLNIFNYLLNSLVAAAIGAIAALILALPAAYAIARHGYGQRIILPIMINLRAMPLIIFAIPLYMMYQFMGLLDTRLGLGLIFTIINLPLTLMILVNAINDIPKELDEAAQLDGIPVLGIIWHIITPLCKPALATALIFGFITAWNEFLFGLMLTTRDAVPMTVGASFFFASSGGGVQWGIAAAVMMVAALPPMLLGLIMYRQISGSIMAGAIKG